MKFADVAGAYLSPSTETLAVHPVEQTPARRLRDALEPIATQGWWAQAVHDRLEAKGLSFFGSYVWGRAAALGDPTAGVVVATFGVFEPSFLTGIYREARALIGRDEVLADREAGAVESLNAIFGVSDADDVRVAGDALLRATDQVAATARPLFSGLRDVAVPESDLGRLWRGAELVREHRGDGHLGACIAAGLDPLEMSVLTELWLGYSLGGYSSSRGYGPEAIAAAQDRLRERGWTDGSGLSDAGRSARGAIETSTDVSQQELIDALGDSLPVVLRVADRVSEAIMAANAFPSDPRKRAAG